MAVDAHKNLIVVDQTTPAVDIIKPPYTSISGTLGSGYTDPLHVTLNKGNTRVFVADPIADDVKILDYPSGASVKTLGYGNGLEQAWGAVEYRNAVY